MNINKLTLTSINYPVVLRQLDQPPPILYHQGSDLNKLLERPAVTIVGSRKISPYGQRVVRDFAKGLAEQGIVIVSGLALGIDAYAHEAALEAGGLCVAVLPCPLDKVVPVRNRDLAELILREGGALVSEYAPGLAPERQNFIARNRIMSGLGSATLIIEAGEKSGALHTARFALEQNKVVLAVPGSIYWPGSIGTNKLIKNSRAGAVSQVKDVLNVLGLAHHASKQPRFKGRNDNEQKILDLLYAGLSDGEEILETSGIPVRDFSHALTMLEIECKIQALGANHWSIY